MTEVEIRLVLSTARKVLASRSKFALFAVDLSHELWPPGQLPIVRSAAAQAENNLFWSEFHTQRVIVE